MRYLLDTHTYLWWVRSPKKLSPRVRALFEDEATTLLFSAASAWEIAIKLGTGKLTSSVPVTRLVVQEPAAQNLEPLPITAAHAALVADLPQHHNDPFDRLLVAQAIAEDVPLLSRDGQLGAYDVDVIW